MIFQSRKRNVSVSSSDKTRHTFSFYNTYTQTEGSLSGCVRYYDMPASVSANIKKYARYFSISLTKQHITHY